MSSDAVAWLERAYDRTMRLEVRHEDRTASGDADDGTVVTSAPAARYVDHHVQPMFTLKDDHETCEMARGVSCLWRWTERWDHAQEQQRRRRQWISADRSALPPRTVWGGSNTGRVQPPTVFAIGRLSRTRQIPEVPRCRSRTRGRTA